MKMYLWKRIFYTLCSAAILIALSITSSICKVNATPIKGLNHSQTQQITTEQALPFISINPSQLRHLTAKSLRDVRKQANLSNNSSAQLLSNPQAIPSGTSQNSTAFFGLDNNSSVVVAADTDGDRLIDVNDDFITSNDPDTETTSAFVVSKRTGKFYLGVVAVDGNKITQGTVIIGDNKDFQGVKSGQINVGKGTPVGMTILNSNAGDILIVASLFFSGDLLDVNQDDRYTITAYLPNANGIPDGSKKVEILKAGATLNGLPINFGFGGLAVDSKGVLYANVAMKAQIGSAISFSGAIMAFDDSNKDGIPDQPRLFISPDTFDTNPMTASSLTIVAGTKFQLLAYGVNDIISQPNQISTYIDNDNDGKIDGGAHIFHTVKPEFQGVFASFGSGTSGVEISHLDFADGIAYFAYAQFDNNGLKVAGVAFVRDDGTGNSSAAKSIYQSPDGNNITFVSGVPLSADRVPPTVQITAPTTGQTLIAGFTVTVNFTSQDDVGVIAHNVAFASDGTNFMTLASGLPGTTQVFQFITPNVATTNGIIRVQAIDGGGNIATATVEMLKILQDLDAPQVSVVAPKTKDKLKGGTTFNVMFTSSDNIGVISHEVQLSVDGGTTFTSLTTALSGTDQSYLFTVPNMKVKKGVIRVLAKDAIGNVGMGQSGIFKIKPTK